MLHAPVGVGEGAADGSGEGGADGDADGSGEGSADGDSDGEAEGSWVGCPELGIGVGGSEGDADGSGEGSADGSGEGGSDGEAEGEGEGAALGKEFTSSIKLVQKLSPARFPLASVSACSARVLTRHNFIFFTINNTSRWSDVF